MPDITKAVSASTKVGVEKVGSELVENTPLIETSWGVVGGEGGGGPPWALTTN
jgi:hypothetical protein